MTEPAKIRELWDAAQPGAEAAADGGGFLGFPFADEPSGLAGAALAVVGLAAGDAAEAPAAIRMAASRYAGWAPAGFRGVDYGDVEIDDADLAKTFVRAHERLADVVAAGAAPLVLGGDPVAGLPVLQVLSGKLRGKLGVVAFTSGYEIDPGPLYAAESRWARALELGVVAPENLALVGGRATPPDAPARAVLEELGVATWCAADVAADGMAAIADDAIAVAAAGTEALYLSVDVGVLEWVGDPAGLSALDLVTGVAAVSAELLAAADVCVPGPVAGAGDGPAAMAARVAAEIVAGIAARLE